MTTQQPMGIQFLKTTFTIKYMWKKHGTAQIEKEKKRNQLNRFQPTTPLAKKKSLNTLDT